MWIKVCGMKTEAAVDAALEAGVSALGFVFAPSPREVTPQEAARLAAPARGHVTLVAVTLHPTPERAAEIFDIFSPDLLQTDWTDLAAVPEKHRDRLLPVLRQGSLHPAPLPTRFLFEGPKSGVGLTADWSVAAGLSQNHELVLAGGLSPDNVMAAIFAVQPFGVDVSSGVEATPGQKSPRKIKEFVNAARTAAAELVR